MPCLKPPAKDIEKAVETRTSENRGRQRRDNSVPSGPFKETKSGKLLEHRDQPAAGENQPRQAENDPHDEPPIAVHPQAADAPHHKCQRNQAEVQMSLYSV